MSFRFSANSSSTIIAFVSHVDSTQTYDDRGDMWVESNNGQLTTWTFMRQVDGVYANTGSDTYLLQQVDSTEQLFVHVFMYDPNTDDKVVVEITE
jgi:hypothetical protein